MNFSKNSMRKENTRKILSAKARRDGKIVKIVGNAFKIACILLPKLLLELAVFSSK